MAFGIKRDKYDAVVSDLVRYRDNCQCQRCGARYPLPSKGLQASHFRGRGHGSTRLDLDNIDALCTGCHRYFTDNQLKHRQWKVARMGLQRVELIEYKARHPLKMNRNEKEILYQDLKRQLENEIIKYESHTIKA
jgi:Bacteriophage Lambda NinG protein